MNLKNIFKGMAPKEDLLTKLEEKKIFNLIVGMLQDPDIKKMIAPNTDEYFLVDDSRKVYVCVEDSNVRISNHDYLIVTRTRMGFTDDLKSTMRNALEVERQALKKELFKNKIDLIDKISINYKQNGIR